jgi:hypothetical protein
VCVCVDMFKRALTYQSEVRTHVYKGLLHLFEAHENVRPFIMDLLYAHFQRYCLSKAEQQQIGITVRNPLRLDRTIDLTTEPVTIVEPLPILLSTILHMLLVQMSAEDLPTVEPGASEFASSALESMHPDQRSTALMRLQCDQLLERILRMTTLKELGINASLVQNATVDEPEGVQAVLQAEGMHGVLLAFMEWQLRSAIDSEEGSEDTPIGTAEPPRFPAASCVDFIKIFDLFWQVHQLLAAKAPKKEAKGGAKKKSSNKKKKQKDSDIESDEEDEEEEDEDEDGENDEERKSNGSAKKKSSSKNGASSKTKAPVKAVAALCRGRHKLHMSGLSVVGVVKLLRLSMPHTGESISASTFHHGSPSSSPLERSARPTLALTRSGSHASTSGGGSQCVGDLLASHAHLQRFLMMSALDMIEGILESTRVSGEWADAVTQILPFAPFFMPRERVTLLEMKSLDTIIMHESEEDAKQRKKDRKEKGESMMTIILAGVLAALRVCEHVGQKALEQLLLHLLSRGTHAHEWHAHHHRRRVTIDSPALVHVSMLVNLDQTSTIRSL